MTEFSRLLGYLKPYRIIFAISIVLMIATGLLERARSLNPRHFVPYFVQGKVLYSLALRKQDRDGDPEQDLLNAIDAHRRGRLVERLLGGGQSVITAAEGELIPERQEISRVAIRDLVGADEERDNGEDPGAGSGGGTS